MIYLKKANLEDAKKEYELTQKIPAEKIAKLVNRILNKRKPKYVYKINRNKLLLLMHLLPKRMQNWAIRRILLKK